MNSVRSVRLSVAELSCEAVVHSQKLSEVKVWECRNCGHIVVGTKAPDVCPVCNHPQAYFEINKQNY